MAVNYKDYYQILGVSKQATEKELKSAYRKLAKQYHPDVNPGKEDKFKDINEAFEVLSDPDKRQRYDMFGANYQQMGGGGFGGGGFPGAGASGNINIEDLMGMFGGAQRGGAGTAGGSGFSDFFEAMFGNMAGGGDPRQAGRSAGRSQQQARHSQAQGHAHAHTQAHASQPVEASMTITLEDLSNQSEKAIIINQKRLTVKIPAGVKSGSKIRLAGQGPQGEDVHLTVNIADHALFQPDGSDLLTDVWVPIPIMVLGGEVTVPILGGGSGQVTIPAATQTDKKIRIKGKGLPKADGQRGDLFARLKPDIPRHPSADERVFYEHLKKAL
jgi:curved DNA-binding protein